jgi:hypothetical protein
MKYVDFQEDFDIMILVELVSRGPGFCWLVVWLPTPLKNMRKSVGMIIHSQLMESHKIPWFQTTKQ